MDSVDGDSYNQFAGRWSYWILRTHWFRWIGGSAFGKGHFQKSLNHFHFLLIPACCLMGAGTMLLCDIIAQLPGSSMTLPINAITALLGSPVVIFVIIRSRNLRSIF
ncbi:UNVERIFIED_CONTAM: hypothetical protein GTU68_054202 [Idotea baltica]|nr:hypothetical protein [Idotea baltica]